MGRWTITAAIERDAAVRQVWAKETVDESTDHA